MNSYPTARSTAGSNGIIYLDNAATSWPKPPAVCEAMIDYQTKIGANPGRSGHRLSVEAGRILFRSRERIARLFNVNNPLRIVFCSNATCAINTALMGILKQGDHVITGSMEHNSVMRPLRALEKKRVSLTVVPCSEAGVIDTVGIQKAMTRHTRLIVINHASNVVGTLAPLRDIGEVARSHDILFLADIAQTAGCYPVDMEADLVDLLAFTGHKSMMGPQGTGGLAIGERVELEDFPPLKTGGTGSKSESEEHPGFLPDKYESGTPNTIGIAGLAEGVDFVLSQGVERIRSHEMTLATRLVEGLQEIDGVTLYGPAEAEKCVATVSFNLNNMMPSEVGYALDEEYDVMCRVGLHCAPAAHRTIQSFPEGTVRLSIGYFNTAEEIDSTIEAIKEIAEEVQGKR